MLINILKIKLQTVFFYKDLYPMFYQTGKRNNQCYVPCMATESI